MTQPDPETDARVQDRPLDLAQEIGTVLTVAQRRTDPDPDHRQMIRRLADWRERALAFDAELSRLQAEGQQVKQERDLLKDGMVEANRLVVDLRTALWEALPGIRGEDRTLVGMVRLLARKLDEAQGEGCFSIPHEPHCATLKAGRRE